MQERVALVISQLEELKLRVCVLEEKLNPSTHEGEDRKEEACQINKD